MSFFAKFRSSRKFQERHQKTYILPTLFGAAFGCVCILLLGIAFASTNNAVYFLCFLLTALGIQSLVLTNRNVDSLAVPFVQVEDFFADEKGYARVRLQNPGKDDLYQIQMELDKEVPVQVEVLRSLENKELQIPFPALPPGLHTLRPLRISSDFPFHLARSWKKHYSKNSFAVFPARKGRLEFAKEAYADLNQNLQSQDEFKSHREYARSDSPRRIDWKVTARSQQMMVKEYDQHNATKVVLRWEDCPPGSSEDKKSQLSLWIDLAEKKNFEYALILPQQRIDFDRGPLHRQQCLRALL